MPTITLVTGGAGYIGSHAVLALIEAGHHVLVIDNLSSGSIEPLNRISEITSRKVLFLVGDVRDSNFLEGVFSNYNIGAVLHFAGLKSVSESITQPSKYYENNVLGSHTLLKVMGASGVFTFVFSSSATVYGDPTVVPVLESCPPKPTNPYGRTKLAVEDMLHDLAAADQRWRVAILRYFNPVGAHESGLIGEDLSETASNLLPSIAQVVGRKQPFLHIYGNDYLTPDGTGIRDYIHVMDLVDGHIKALEALCNLSGTHVWNLGTGQGHSVLELVNAFEKASGHSIPYRIVSRRPGDVATSYASVSKVSSQIGWRAKRGLAEMMRDSWRWQLLNPDGYS